MHFKSGNGVHHAWKQRENVRRMTHIGDWQYARHEVVRAWTWEEAVIYSFIWLALMDPYHAKFRGNKYTMSTQLFSIPFPNLIIFIEFIITWNSTYIFVCLCIILFSVSPSRKDGPWGQTDHMYKYSTNTCWIKEYVKIILNLIDKVKHLFWYSSTAL